MNQITIMGRFTRDPELRETPSGIPVASFSLAVDRGYTPKNGEKRHVDFIDVVAWRGTGQFVNKYFAKGQMATVTGRLQIRNWTDKNNNNRRNAEVVAENIYFTGNKNSQGSPVTEDDIFVTGTVPKVEPSDYADADFTIDEDDLPF